jgi:dienelactone hydrolase
VDERTSTTRRHSVRVSLALPAIAALASIVLLTGCSSLPAPQPFPAPASSNPAAGGSLRPAGGSAHPAVKTFKTFTTRVMLHGQPLELHMAVPDQPAPDAPIVLYASGDGGWFGAAVDMFHQLARAGYPVVGFSSRAFLKIQRPHGGLVNAAQLAADYEAIVTHARAALHQSDANRVVLTGWSRGAAFSVLAASEPAGRGRLAGIIAIGLSAGEDLAATSDDDATDDGQPDETGRNWRFDNYATIGRLGPLACAVIQASHDNYLPAAAARRLFGPDTDRRRLYAIDAKNHRFSGGRAAFDAALLDALRWIASQPEPAAPPAPPTPSTSSTSSTPPERNS